MNILIHGRKNGYTVLYPKPTPTEFYSFASDIQSISANNYDVYYGKKFYTLSFVDSGCVFTKYVIGDDVQRGQLGEIGISIFIPNTHKLSGADVKTLLDELINSYCRNYISDNKIDEPKNGFDWMLFTSLANGYDAKLQSRSTNNDNVTTGTQDPAFHYNKSESELIEHLDKPFQEEYSDYRQILFIDSNLQGPGNPLNVIKNSGVEVNPDLKNKYYFLNNYNLSKGVTISAYYNNKWNDRSDKKGENQIRAKWKVEIKYSKDDRCYDPINVHGTLYDTTSEIYKYLDIKDNQIIIKYNAFNPTPKTISVKFEIKNGKGNDISSAEITCKNNNYQPAKTVTNNQIIFKGEEIIKPWSVIVRKGDFSGKTEFTPEKKTNESVEIIIEERNIITINVKNEEGKDLSDFEVWTKLTNGYQRSNTIEFVDEQIIDSYHVTVRKDGYENKNIQDFQPYKHNSIDVTLIKKQENTQPPNGPHLHNYEPEKQKSSVAKAKTFFSKPIGIATLIVIALVLGIGIWALCCLLGNNKQPKENSLTAQRITAYVEGDSLMLNKLNNYKENWKSQEQNFITKSGVGIFGGDENVDSTKWRNDWKPVYKSIDRAIKKRELIDEKNFEKLQEQRYSNKQLPFKTIIIKIDSTKYKEVVQKLSDVSALTLTQIADSINAILTLIRQEEKEKQAQRQEQKEEEKGKVQIDEPEYITRYLETSSDFQSDSINKYYYNVRGLSTDLNNSLRFVKDFINGDYENCETFKTNALNDKFLKKNQNLESWVNKVCKDGQNISNNQTDASTGNTSTIIQYIKSSELNKKTLDQYLKNAGINKTLNASIKLCLKLWSLDGSRNNSYSSYQKKLNKDANLKNSELKVFVDEMCGKEHPKYVKDMPTIDQKRMKSLSKIKSEILQ